MKIWLYLLLILSANILYAQDTLWVKEKEGKPYLVHKVKSGEDIFLLSKKYAVPPALLADLNEITYQQGLSAGTEFKIPIDNFNYIRLPDVGKSRPLFYKVREEDDLRSISHLFKVSQRTIQLWNEMPVPEIEVGQVLQTGWIAFNDQIQPFNRNTTTQFDYTNTASSDTNIIAKDKSSVTTPLFPVEQHTNKKENKPEKENEDSALEFKELFAQQTNGLETTEESGAAVTYAVKTKMNRGVYYAFHNNAEKGTILKIMNPANRRVIYAKVLGPIPELSSYHNAIVVLSNNAFQALGVKDKRMFCKIKYR